MKKIKKLGIIAGGGDLPKLLIKECKKNKTEPVCILVKGFVNEKDYKNTKHITLSFGFVGKALQFLRDNSVKDIVFAGKVDKPPLKSVRTDIKGLVLLKELIKNKFFGDNKVLDTVVKFFEKEGLKVLQVDDLLSDNKIRKGYKGKVKISDKKYLDDIKIGLKALKKISDLDIGQSIVVQQGTIIGVECMEGTAELIKRCEKIKYKSGRKPVLIKIKKLRQTKKADLPTIGKETIKQLAQAGFAGLAIDAKNCLVLDKKLTLDLALKKKIFILGV